MSDEENSLSEAFSASEDEWRPSEALKGGESSDDDDSEFEESPLAGAASGGSGTSAGRKTVKPKARSTAKQISSKKRTTLSLRTKLYNKYRPPPKTSQPISIGSAATSTSRTISKNANAPNESKSIRRRINDDEYLDSSSDSSIENYLVNPEDLDIKSSFFNVEDKQKAMLAVSSVPSSDRNEGLEALSDSASDSEKDEAKKVEKPFEFNNFLEYAKKMERVKECVDKYNAEKTTTPEKNIDALDVYAVLALGEKQNRARHERGNENDESLDEANGSAGNQPSKLSKKKSTRVKRHVKTRPTSTVANNDTDDSDWEEIADLQGNSEDVTQIGNLEICVELPSRNRETKTKTQLDIENAVKRKANRDIRERQILLHKMSLLCLFARTFFYNRMLNNVTLMQTALKLLPSKSSYPPQKGTEIKYFQSMVTWLRSTIKLETLKLYPETSAANKKRKPYFELLKQIEEKVACCKQDMIFIFIILLRGMGLQCRLVVNIQPIPLKPLDTELFKIKIKNDDKVEDKTKEKETKPKAAEQRSEEAKKKMKNVNVENPKNGMGTKNESNVKTKKQTEDTHTKLSVSVNLENEKSMKRKLKSYQMQKSDNVEKDHDAEILRAAPISTRSKRTKSENSEEGNHKKKPAIESKAAMATKTIKQVEKSPFTLQKERDAEILRAGPTLTRSKRTKRESSEEENHKKKTSIESKAAMATTTNKHVEKSPIPITLQKEHDAEILKVGPSLTRSKRTKQENSEGENHKKKPSIESDAAVATKPIKHAEKYLIPTEQTNRNSRSRSKSPNIHISTDFLLSNKHKNQFPGITEQSTNDKTKSVRAKTLVNKVKISTDFLKNSQHDQNKKRVLRSRQKSNNAQADDCKALDTKIPQLDGANDKIAEVRKDKNKLTAQHDAVNSDEDFEPSPSKKPKAAPSLSKQNRRVVSSDDENEKVKNATAGDMWVEVWCDVEEQWVCADIFNNKVHCVDIIRKSASSPLAYVFAFQNDLSIKDVTARYCSNWTTVIRKSRVDNIWLDAAISKYLGQRTMRDIKEDEELRRIHEEKPLPTAISDYKNHPFYALERHLLKFEGFYPPNPPVLGHIRGESVYSRDCVQTLHSRDIWLKQARTVKLGETPYKIVKARPKWDKLTQTVIRDQNLELFGYWQTQDYEPPTAENGVVPRNAYGNVELFKPTMLPKKTKHIRLPGLNRICKKLGIDCANAVIGFDFHQGVCHPLYDGFIVCEEFADQVVAAWYQEQEEQEQKEQEKYEARVYGNWKKLIRGLLICKHLKLKHKF